MALTDTFVRNIKYKAPSPANKYSDGGGLYLLVNPAGKYWRLNYRFTGKQKTLALGVYPQVSLLTARQRRDKARQQLAEGIDPGQHKREKKRLLAETNVSTFKTIAQEWVQKTGLTRADSTQKKILNWLENDIFPYLGNCPISNIRPREVLSAVQHMEARGAIESAHRLLNVCSQVFRYGVAIGVVERDVTADLRGALTPAPSGHHAAITDPRQVGKLMLSIHEYDGHSYTKAALKLLPLVFVRPGELRSAEWTEIDFEKAEWRIPGAKMKMRGDHIVPLSKQAIEILHNLHPLTGQEKYLFPSAHGNRRCMSENTINQALRRLGYGNDVMTGHGFRAMARTLLDEVLGERPDFIEHQLAHAVRDPNGRAYNRTTHLPERRAMMQRWADYLDQIRNECSAFPLKED